LPAFRPLILRFIPCLREKREDLIPTIQRVEQLAELVLWTSISNGQVSAGMRENVC
jgi:hypothetical protein